MTGFRRGTARLRPGLQYRLQSARKIAAVEHSDALVQYRPYNSRFFELFYRIAGGAKALKSRNEKRIRAPEDPISCL
jgi:hypothetical protein